MSLLTKGISDSKKVRFTTALLESSSEPLHQASTSIGDDAQTFNTAKVAHTPKIGKVHYKNPEERPAAVVAPASSISRPNHEDIMRRVSIVIHQHIQKCESRLQKATPENCETGLFHTSKMRKFEDKNYISPKYVYHFVRIPINKLGFIYSIRKVKMEPTSPTLNEVFLFMYDLFIKADLSSECSIVCLIYVERLMELGNVPLVGATWKSCVLCALLLASKVWQDIGSWNREIAEIYPEFSLQSINRLEKNFCQEIKWNLNISSSVYAKYYFALRSLAEKQDFRRKYNATFVDAPGAQIVQERSEGVKDSVMQETLSKSF